MTEELLTADDDVPVLELADASDAAIAVAEAPAAAAPAAVPSDVPTCVKCGTPMNLKKTSWCLRCGWYPQINRFVELDPWDKEVPEGTEPEPKKSIWQMLPAWAWLLIGGTVVLLIISIAFRMIIPAESSVRTAWSVAQLGTGVLVFLVAHVGCYMFAIMQTDRLQILDLLLRPIAIWSYTVKELPQGFRRVAAGAWGLWAAVLALLVVGGIPWAAIWDWGGEPQAKKTLVRAITDAARGAKGKDQSLDEAVKDFAGEAGVDDLKKKPPVERRMATDCLIMGYVPLGNDGFQSLLLASVVDGRLRYVGPVTDGVPPEVRRLLNDRMPELLAPAPVVKAKTEGVWLKPVMVCRVRFKDWTPDKRLNKPLFDAMLADVEAE